MSFGEPTCTPNKGRFVELANELVYKVRGYKAGTGSDGQGMQLCYECRSFWQVTGS